MAFNIMVISYYHIYPTVDVLYEYDTSPVAKQIITTVQNRLENSMSRPRMGSKEMHKNARY